MKYLRTSSALHLALLSGLASHGFGCSGAAGVDPPGSGSPDGSASNDASGAGSGSPAGSGSGVGSGSGAATGSGSTGSSGAFAGSGSTSGTGSGSSSGASGGLDSGKGLDGASSSGSGGTTTDAGAADASASTCPAPPPTEPAAAITAVNAVNAVRLRMGLPCSTLVPTLDVAAQAHCVYYAANASNTTCSANPHVEVASCPSFYAAQFWTRDTMAGYTARGAGSEVMEFSGNPATAVQTWVDSVWHRTPLLSPWMRDLGYGGTTTPAGCDTIDLATGATTPSTVTAVYPYDGETGIPTSFNGSFEGPTPPAPPSGWPSGYPVHLYLRGGTVQTHTIAVDGSATPLAHVWIDQTNATNGPDQFILYANMPLARSTTYHVQIGAMRGTMALTFDWKFTTGAR